MHSIIRQMSTSARTLGLRLFSSLRDPIEGRWLASFKGQGYFGWKAGSLVALDIERADSFRLISDTERSAPSDIKATLPGVSGPDSAPKSSAVQITKSAKPYNAVLRIVAIDLAMPLANVHLGSNNTFRFTLEHLQIEGQITFEGAVDGDQISGQMTQKAFGEKPFVIPDVIFERDGSYDSD